MDIKKFINKKSLEFKNISGDELEDFLDEYNLLFKESKLVRFNRDFIFATKDNDIVGFAILFRSENSYTPLENVVSLSNIEVNKDFQNNGIATALFDKVIEFAKNSNKILKRSQPTDDGEAFIQNKFSKTLKEKEISYIPYNLAFLYERLTTNKLLENKSHKEKIKTLHDFEQKILQHPKLIELKVQSLNQNFLIEADEIINTEKNKHKNRTLKIK